MRASLDRCLAERGQEPLGPGSFQAELPDTYGLVDGEWARIYGYVSPGSVQQAVTEPRTSEQIDAEVMQDLTTPEFEAALRGVEPEVEVTTAEGQVILRYRPDGCLYLAELEHDPQYFERAALTEQIMGIANRAIEWVRASEEYVELEQRWASCMNAAGYTPTSIQSPDDQAVYTLEDQTQESIDQAVQDVACKNSTGILHDWSRMLAGKEREFLNESPGLMEAWNALDPLGSGDVVDETANVEPAGG